MTQTAPKALQTKSSENRRLQTGPKSPGGQIAFRSRYILDWFPEHRVREAIRETDPVRWSGQPRSISAMPYDHMMRARVERLLTGKFRVLDLQDLLLFLRARSDGRETVREIGDFVATALNEKKV